MQQIHCKTIEAYLSGPPLVRDRSGALGEATRHVVTWTYFCKICRSTIFNPSQIKIAISLFSSFSSVMLSLILGSTGVALNNFLK